MNLLIDAGNSYAKLALYDQGTFHAVGSYSHQCLVAQVVCQLEQRDIEQIFLASVATPSLVGNIRELAERQGVPFTEVHAEPYAFGLINGYQNYATLGVDRWLAMLAVRRICRRPFLVIDLGTAITVDLVDEFGQHKGGWIAPGYRTMRESLSAKTVKITDNSKISPDTNLTFALSTAQCVASGVQSAMTGILYLAIETAQRNLRSHLPVMVYVTGGDSRYLPLAAAGNIFIRDNLVLEGLACYVVDAKSSD